MHLLGLQQSNKGAVTIPNYSGNEIKSASRHHKLSDFEGHLLVQYKKVQKVDLSVENTKSFISTEIRERKKAREKEAKWERKNDQVDADLLG